MSFLQQLFKKTEERKKQESEERTLYIQYITDFTDSVGVRETSRMLEESGFSVSHAKISQIRNNSSEYSVEYIASLCEAISSLKLEKKLE